MGTQHTLVYEGYLLKKSSTGWKRRYFTLLSNRALVRFECHRKQKAIGEILLNEKVQLLNMPGTTYGFRVVAGAVELILQAESSVEYHAWIAQIESVGVVNETEQSTGRAVVTPPSQQRTETQRSLPRTMSVTTILGKQFVLDPRYTDLKGIGQGAYGLVVSCTDTCTGKRVAIKKISSLFDDAEDAKRIIREIRFMRTLNHPKLLGLIDIFEPITADYNEIYMASELMDTDLHKVIKSGQTLTEDHQRYIMYQILLGLKHLHACGLVHRDLKPSNILLSLRCEVKICDFGLARVNNPEACIEDSQGRMTEYVVTRWYRAPEVMLSSGKYSTIIDIWSAGCVFAEMQLGEPLFRGKDYIQQLKLITKFLGNPSGEDLAFIKKQRAKDFMERLAVYPPVHLHHMFPRLSQQGRSLIGSMLVFNPNNRITAADAVALPYFDRIRDSALEAAYCTPVNADDIEAVVLQTSALRNLMTREIRSLRVQMNPSCTLSPKSDLTNSTEGMTPNSQRSTSSRQSSTSEVGTLDRKPSWFERLGRKKSMSTADVPQRARVVSERFTKQRSASEAGEDSDGEAEEVQTLWRSNARSRPQSERFARGGPALSQGSDGQGSKVASVTPTCPPCINICMQVAKLVRHGSYRKAAPQPVVSQSG